MNSLMSIAAVPGLFDDLPVSIPEGDETEGKTSLYVADESRVIGAVVLADKMRENAPGVISDLKRSRIRTEMLTGDNEDVASADVGIAMGHAGTDVAIETADIALMHDDLSKIDYLVYLSRKTMQVVKQNIAAALFIKGTLTVMAVFGLINLWVAVGVGDMGLSLAVILNAMRLTRVKA